MDTLNDRVARALGYCVFQVLGGSGRVVSHPQHEVPPVPQELIDQHGIEYMIEDPIGDLWGIRYPTYDEAWQMIIGRNDWAHEWDSAMRLLEGKQWRIENTPDLDRIFVTIGSLRRIGAYAETGPAAICEAWLAENGQQIL